MSVIAITGTMGSGKTTVARGLGERLSCPVLCEDDFNPAFARSVDDVAVWWQQGGDVQQFDFTQLAVAIEQSRSCGELVILETHFGRQHSQLRPLIDLQLWLDVPFDIAFARKAGQLCRELADGRTADPQTADPQTVDPAAGLRWMAAFCDAWLHVTRPMFTWQKSVIGGQSDERLDAQQPPAVLLERVCGLLPQNA